MEYSAPGHPERPERIARTVPLLKSRHAEWEWRAPGAATDEMLLRAHTRAHLDRVKSATQDFDADTASGHIRTRGEGSGRGCGRGPRGAGRRASVQPDAAAWSPRDARARHGFLLFQQHRGRRARRPRERHGAGRDLGFRRAPWQRDRRYCGGQSADRVRFDPSVSRLSGNRNALVWEHS